MNIKSKITNKSLKQLEKISGEKLTFGRLLYAIRAGEAMTQIAFAKKLGISKQHLCDLEHNRKKISLKLAAEYAKKLGYSQEQFIRLCLQDMVDREGLEIIIEAKPRQKIRPNIAHAHG